MMENNLKDLLKLCPKFIEFLGKLLITLWNYYLFYDNIKCKYRCQRNTLWNLFHVTSDLVY